MSIDHSADWRTRLTQAMQGVSEEDQELMVDAALGWPTCACAELDYCIERNEIGAPMDGHLRSLGGRFFGFVCEGAFAKALTTLDAIEARAQELKP